MKQSAASVVKPPALPPRMASRVAVGEALLGQPEGRVRAVLDVDDAPALMELVAEGAAVTGRAAVVDIHDREARGS